MVSPEALLNNLDEAIFLFDRKGRVLLTNKAAEEFLGRNLREIRQGHVRNLFSGSRDIVMLTQKTISEGRSFNCRDIEIDIGRMVNIDVNLSPFYLDNSLEGAILCIRENLDLTEREDYHFDSLLYLLGSIAHEIKNPLSGIKGAAQLLRGAARDPEAIECVNLIVKETDRLNSVLHSYLTMTKKPAFHELNIHEILEYALKLMDAVIEEKKIRIEKSYDPSLPGISGDESKLLQVFINLLKNAAEAMDGMEGPRQMNIATRPSDEYVVIHQESGPNRKETGTTKQRWVVVTIQDNGTGIPREEINRIFLPFYTRKEGGSGLGLALSKKIIKDHGGIIKVKSAGKSGTTFSLYLPYR